MENGKQQQHENFYTCEKWKGERKRLRIGFLFLKTTYKKYISKKKLKICVMYIYFGRNEILENHDLFRNFWNSLK